MIGQVDVYGFLRFTTSSLFANMVVIGLLAGMVCMAFGTAWLAVRRDLGIKILVYGGILIGLLASLAAVQFGAIPVTFDGVASIGLATFPAEPVMVAFQATMNFILGAISWAASLMAGIGLAMLIGSRGGEKSFTLILLGVVMSGIGGLLGSGGMITWIMNYLGVAAPVVA